MALPTTCPLCNAGPQHLGCITSHVFGSKANDNRAFFKCTNCDAIFQYPRLTEEEEIEFYKSEFENFMNQRSGKEGGWLKAEEHVRANQKTLNRRLSYIDSYLTNKMSILEIGCSSGFMLSHFKSLGHDCKGIEPSGAFNQFVESKGIEVFDSIEKLKEAKLESFDLIMHFFVLEHIQEPKKFLEDQLDILDAQGTLIIEVPNSADPLFTLYDIPEFERFYWSKAHPWYFSEKSLSYLLSQLNCTFSIQLEQRYDLSNHMVWARDGKPGGMSLFSDTYGKAMDDAYKQSLISAGLSDTLVAFVKQRGA